MLNSFLSWSDKNFFVSNLTQMLFFKGDVKQYQTQIPVYAHRQVMDESRGSCTVLREGGVKLPLHLPDLIFLITRWKTSFKKMLKLLFRS